MRQAIAGRLGGGRPVRFIQTFELYSFLDSVVSLGVAFVLGVLIGAERQYRQRTAGLRTTVLVIIGELFFRANGLRAGMQMFRTMVTGFAFPVFDDALFKALGIDKFDLMIVAVTLLIVFVVSVINEKGKSVRALLAQRPAAVRWTVFYALILFIIVFGAYGKGYIPVDPMYANF